METKQRTIAGRYRLVEPLGSGGMGTVWRAEDTVLAREVAVKEVTFPPGVTDEEREVLQERTRREARAAARLDHPSAVTVYDVAEEEGTPYLVMELVQARTLADVVRTDGPLTPRQTAEVGLAVLGALESAHAQGIVHRDVKPGNVLLRDDGRVVLTDFGIATFTGDSSITSTGLLLGSPSYIAPERAKGEQPGPASDLWSLGATLFTAVEGRAPFDKGEALPTLTAVVAGEHAPYRSAGPLAPVLDGLLAREPGQRLDAAGARAQLTEVLTAPESAAVDTAPAAPVRPARTPRAERTTALDVEDVLVEVTPAPLAARPAAARRRSPVGLVAGILGLVLVAGLVAAGTAALRQSDGDDRGRAAGNGAAGTSADSAAVVPSGWATYTDAAGWKIAHPKGWAVTTYKNQRQFRDPATRRTLRVGIREPALPDAVGDWEDQAKAFAARYPSYSKVRIEAHDFRGYRGADWEFRYTTEGARLHVLDRAFVVAGRGYSLYWQVPDSDWDDSQDVFEQLAGSFQPK